MMDGYRFVRGVARVLAKLFFRAEYHGRENEPAEGAFIAYSNHTSLYDPIFTASALRRPLYFVAKSELENNFFMRWLFKLCNVVPIRRGESDLAALRKTCDIIKAGNCPAIYPEGTRIPQFAPCAESAQAGLGLMVTRTKCPVLPVAICYGKNKSPRIFRKVHVYIGEPIGYEELASINEKPNSAELSEYAFSRLCEIFGENNARD